MGHSYMHFCQLTLPNIYLTIRADYFLKLMSHGNFIPRRLNYVLQCFHLSKPPFMDRNAPIVKSETV